MLSLANIYTLYFRLYFRLCICLNKLSINQYNKWTLFESELCNRIMIQWNSVKICIQTLFIFIVLLCIIDYFYIYMITNTHTYVTNKYEQVFLLS